MSPPMKWPPPWRTGRYRATSDESELNGFDVAVIDVPDSSP